jgi:hypothetical protein
MPSVEIICVNQLEPIDYSNVPFRVYAENELVSHRTPSPLFQADFDNLKGCIYHLCQHPKGAYTAGGLLTQWWDILHFKDDYSPYIKQMLQELLEASPIKRLVFTSDYQFGPDEKRYKRPITLARFWEIHDAKKLRVNALYPIRV